MKIVFTESYFPIHIEGYIIKYFTVLCISRCSTYA